MAVSVSLYSSVTSAGPLRISAETASIQDKQIKLSFPFLTLNANSDDNDYIAGTLFVDDSY